MTALILVRAPADHHHYIQLRTFRKKFQGVPDDPVLQAERDLRIEELTAKLDGSTGGWF